MSAAIGTANFAFKDRSAFFELPDDPTTELPTVVLPVGSVVYRADHAGAKEPGADVPAFFSNHESTGTYTHGVKGSRSSYIVKKEARLFHMNLNSLMELANYVGESGGDTTVFVHYISSWEGDLFVNPSGFTPSDMENYKKGAVAHPNYLNRRMAEIVCALGFDGWVVKPFSIEKKTGLPQISYAKLIKIEEAREQVDRLLPALRAEKDPEKKKALAVEIKPFAELASLSPIIQYKPEIMLCAWKTHMDVKALPAPNNNGGNKGVTLKARRRRLSRKGRR
jgi:hypothetical protein